MQIKCPYCAHKALSAIETRKDPKKNGSFYRQSDRKKVQRFFCSLCDKHFSVATSSRNCWQKKRHINHQIARLLVAGVSQREGARVLKINRKTFVRKFIFMGILAKEKLHRLNLKYPKAIRIQFDDLETFEHTKCKPLSVTLAVEEESRRILGYEVAQMPAKGHLAGISRRKYGFRKDYRPLARERLFTKLQDLVIPGCQIKSDENPHYPYDVKRFFPKAEHKTYLGRKGAVTGQGELKKIGRDPIFALNHTCAMLRYKMSRLIRKTWNTTKLPAMLDLHLAIEALHHNSTLQPRAAI